MIWISIILIKASFVMSDGGEKPNLYPYMGDITSQLYVALRNDTKVYKMSNVEDIMNDTRRNIIFNFNLVFDGGEMKKRSIVCYMTSVTYRAAMWDLYRYFHIRDLYVDNLEFEIGYLTQEVIHHYEVILEIYQMVDRRYIQYQEKNYGPVGYNFFLYANILEKSKIIIHLCNMMHELENKYKQRKTKGVFAEVDDHGGGRGAGSLQGNITMVEILKAESQKKAAAKAKEDKRLRKEHKKQLKSFNKFGMTTRRMKRAKKKGSWPLDYGWSIEDW